MSEVEILFLDDELVVAERIALEIELSNDTPNFTYVENHRDLAAALKLKSFDIILVDYVVPGTTGIEILQLVQQIAPTTPVIVISGKVDEAVLVEAIRAGARDYICKDNLRRLSNAVERAIEESRLLQEHNLTTTELQRSEQLLSEISQRIPAAMYEFIMRPDGSSALPFVSKQFEHLTGVKAEQVKDDALPAFERILADDMEGLMHSIQVSAENLSHWSYDFRARNEFGELIWIHGSSIPTRDEAGVTHWHGIFEDTTELHKAHEIRDQFFQLTNDLLFITDLEGQILKIGGSTAKLLGYQEEELLEKTIQGLIPEEDSQQFLLVMQHATQKKENQHSLELRILTKQGDTLWLSWDAILTAGDTRIFYTAQDVTQHKNYENELEERVSKRTEELEESKKSAEEANQAKTHFLSNMSHELRTPLNSILGFAQLLDLSSDIQVKYKEDITQILDAGKHLLTLVEDLLDLSLIERNKLEFHFEPVSLKQQLMAAVSTMQPVARDKGLRLKLLDDVINNDMSVMVDAVRFKQIFLNLISNAIKYNRPHGSVDVYVETEDDLVSIIVEDTGIGIENTKIDELFLPFNRQHQALHASEGTGIGLAITKYLVEQMQGSIQVESTVGKGTKFITRFAFSSQQAQQPVDDNAQNNITQDRAKILYIEDSPSHIDFMHRVFEDMSNTIELITANTPRLGFELARAHTPTIILMDICLPGISGVDLMMRLQEDVQLSHIPVVAISANAHPTQIEEGLRSGFRRYLTKPVDVVELRRVVNELLVDCATHEQ